MVSPNLESIGDEFNDMVEERDWMGFVALAGAGALGGVLAEMFHDRVAPRLNQPANPSGAQGLVTSFGIKAVAALVLGFLSVRAGGSAAMALAVLAVGATIDAGVDLIEAGDTLRTASPAGRSSGGRSRRKAQPSASQNRARRATQNRNRATPNRRPTGSSSSSSSSNSSRASI